MSNCSVCGVAVTGNGETCSSACRQAKKRGVSFDKCKVCERPMPAGRASELRRHCSSKCLQDKRAKPNTRETKPDRYLTEPNPRSLPRCRCGQGGVSHPGIPTGEHGELRGRLPVELDPDRPRAAFVPSRRADKELPKAEAKEARKAAKRAARKRDDADFSGLEAHELTPGSSPRTRKPARRLFAALDPYTGDYACPTCGGLVLAEPLLSGLKHDLAIRTSGALAGGRMLNEAVSTGRLKTRATGVELPKSKPRQCAECGEWLRKGKRGPTCDYCDGSAERPRAVAHSRAGAFIPAWERAQLSQAALHELVERQSALAPQWAFAVRNRVSDLREPSREAQIIPFPRRRAERLGEAA